MLPSGIHFKDHARGAALLATVPQRVAFGAAAARLIAAFPLVASAYVARPGDHGVRSRSSPSPGCRSRSAWPGSSTSGSRPSSASAPSPRRSSTQLGVPCWSAIAAGRPRRRAWSASSSACRRCGSEGFYLALTTLAAQVMFPIVMLRLPTGWFGGSAGIGIDRVESLGVALRDAGALLLASPSR